MEEKCLKPNLDFCILQRSYPLLTTIEVFNDKQAEQLTALLNKGLNK